MTKLVAWKCDVCGKEFSNIIDLSDHELLKIEIPLGSSFTDIFDYKDTCYDCRDQIDRAINVCITNLIKNRKK